ncbi:MAG: hypothetical protein IPI49_09425 [Myxococcales bacterium]|nr:hypothetical protein [Myxococcales bacterium]
MQSFAATIGDTVYALFADSQRVGIRRYEDGGAQEVAERLTPEVAALLERGGALLGSIVQRYESSVASDSQDEVVLEEPQGSDELFGQVAAVERPPTVVAADVAFMAQAELRQHQQRLQTHSVAGDVQEMISDCGSALRAILKSLYAMEPLLCAIEQLSPFLPSHLGTSLEVRRHYRKLWAFANAVGDVTADTVRAALRGAGTRISILAGSEVYSLLREDDRFYIRELQLRILEWLRSGTDHAAAVRIWQDFALFVEILRQINLREELIGHDRVVLRRAMEALAARGAEALEEVTAALRPALGVDDKLDEVLLSGAGATALLRELRRVVGQLSGAADESPARSMAL